MVRAILNFHWTLSDALCTSPAMPLEGFFGGLMTGIAAALMLLGLGRIAGVSGMAAHATGIAAGGTLFGAGWGISGLCPGPGLADLAINTMPALAFVSTLFAGMLAHCVMNDA